MGRHLVRSLSAAALAIVLAFLACDRPLHPLWIELVLTRPSLELQRLTGSKLLPIPCMVCRSQETGPLPAHRPGNAPRMTRRRGSLNCCNPPTRTCTSTPSMPGRDSRPHRSTL